MSPKSIRKLFAIHRLTGAFASANLLVMALTGTILIFHDEIDRATGRTAVAVSSTASLRPWPELVMAARAARPGEKPLFAFAEEGKPDVLHVGMAAPGVRSLEKSTVVSVDARTVRPLNVGLGTDGPTAFILKLHSELFLGPVGKVLVGLVGLCLLTSLCTGLVVYGPAMRRFAFGMLRRGGRRSLLIADAHKLIGASLAGWLLVVALTGVLLTLGTFVIQLYQVTTLASMTAAYRGRPAPALLAPLATVIARATDAYPQDELAFITFPGTELSGDHHFGVFTRARNGLARKLIKIVLVDARTGAITAARELPWFVKGLLLAEPLHFGDYGGLPLKVLWALFGVGTTGIAGSGLYVFVARRRGRRAGANEIAGPLSAATEVSHAG